MGSDQGFRTHNNAHYLADTRHSSNVRPNLLYVSCSEPVGECLVTSIDLASFNVGRGRVGWCVWSVSSRRMMSGGEAAECSIDGCS